MTEIEKATREVCEKLGLHWHETVWKNTKYRTAGGKSVMDKCCVCVKCGERHAVNPDFSTAAGRVQLLKIMVEHGGWFDFLGYIYKVKPGEPTVYPNNVPVDYLTDDSGSLLFAVRDWFRRQNHEL